MTAVAFFLIVASAILHASWNLIAKKNKMCFALYALICIPGTLFWSHVQFWTPIPVYSLPWNFWAFIVATVIADALIYGFGLIYAYKKMDMASAYPMMRALPIILITIVTALLGWGKAVPYISVFGFFLVFCGSLLMPLSKFSDFKLSNYLNPGIFFVLCAAVGTTCYTICDSQCLEIMRDYCQAEGIEVSKPILSLTYYSTRSINLVILIVTFSLCFKSEREALKTYWREKNFMPLVGGLCASGTYILVLIAMNYVTNVSYVQVCRQLGLPIGMIAGILVLKERNSLVKWIGVSLILAGLAIAILYK